MSLFPSMPFGMEAAAPSWENGLQKFARLTDKRQETDEAILAEEILVGGAKIGGEFALAAGGTAGGAVVGALIGSAVPVIGTVAGAMIGSALGSSLGVVISQKWIHKKTELDFGPIVATAILSGVTAGSGALLAASAKGAAGMMAEFFFLGAAKFISASSKTGVRALAQRAVVNIAQGAVYRTAADVEFKGKSAGEVADQILDPKRIVQDALIGEAAHFGINGASRYISKRIGPKTIQAPAPKPAEPTPAEPVRAVVPEALSPPPAAKPPAPRPPAEDFYAEETIKALDRLPKPTDPRPRFWQRDLRFGDRGIFEERFFKGPPHDGSPMPRGDLDMSALELAWLDGNIIPPPVRIHSLPKGQGSGLFAVRVSIPPELSVATDRRFIFDRSHVSLFELDEAARRYKRNEELDLFTFSIVNGDMVPTADLYLAFSRSRAPSLELFEAIESPLSQHGTVAQALDFAQTALGVEKSLKILLERQIPEAERGTNTRLRSLVSEIADQEQNVLNLINDIRFG